MMYQANMRAAANRHYRDANFLFEDERFDNAGYHYGFAAECALKGAMGREGIAVEDVEVDGRTAYYVHFPELKRIPVKQAGRLSQRIATLLVKAQFLQGWHIKMRYAKTNSVTEQQCERWKQQVTEFVNVCMGL